MNKSIVLLTIFLSSGMTLFSMDQQTQTVTKKVIIFPGKESKEFSLDIPFRCEECTKYLYSNYNNHFQCTIQSLLEQISKATNISINNMFLFVRGTPMTSNEKVTLNEHLLGDIHVQNPYDFANFLPKHLVNTVVRKVILFTKNPDKEFSVYIPLNCNGNFENTGGDLLKQISTFLDIPIDKLRLSHCTPIFEYHIVDFRKIYPFILLKPKDFENYHSRVNQPHAPITDKD